MSIPSRIPSSQSAQPVQASGAPSARMALPPLSAGTLLRLWRDVQGRWSAGPAQGTTASPVWEAADLVQALGAERLDALLNATSANASALVRVLAASPRLELELELLATPLAETAVAGDSGRTLDAMQPALPPWMRSGASAAPGPAEARSYAAPTPPQAWAEQSLAALRLGRPLPAPFTNVLWAHSRPLSEWLGIEPGTPASALPPDPSRPRLSLLLLWQAEPMGIELTGNRTALDVELFVSSPYAMQLARARWPHWDGAIGRAGARARGWRWHQRRLRYPTRRDAFQADPDLLRLAAELLWSL
ncbi:MAG: hypothetical protein JO369_04830 [Paucibacter sp.]|nr:hypothetical protein [Roseateles sp.]